MPAVTLPNATTKAGYIDGEAWGEDMNRNLRIIDALMNCVVTDRGISDPPGAPSGGSVYILGPAATGAWAGQVGGTMAIRAVGSDITSTWIFVVPKIGWRVYVNDESAWYEYRGGSWQLDTTLGVNTYAQIIGDGTSGSFTIYHGLGTRNVTIEVYRNGTPWDSLNTTQYIASRPSSNEVTVSSFALTPSVNQWVVVIRK